MAVSSTTTLANTYQKYFSKVLLKNQIQLTVLDQFGLKQPLPTKAGAKIISFFRRSNSAVNSSGVVANVVTLTEGVPINSFADATMARVDVPLVQYGEATKVTDIETMTELFDALKQNIDLMSEDSALNADCITRNALVIATNTGVTLNNASGTTTEKIAQIYAQGLASFSALNSASVSGGKVAATDFLRSVTTLKINRAPMWSGKYVAAIPPQISHDLQNDPDWIDAANYGDPSKRFRGELGEMYGCRFVEHTNPFVEDTTGTEHTYSVSATAGNRAYRTFIFGKGSFGVPSIGGASPYNPRVMIVNTPDKSDILNQYVAAGWKSYWAAAALNCPYALSLTSKTEYA